MTTTRDFLFLLLAGLLFLYSSFNVHCHPNRFIEDDDGNEEESRNTWTVDGDLNEGNEHDARRDEVLQKLQEVLGIRSHGEKTGHRKVPPQFMLELYNNVADPSGVTRGRNPYNAKVVRSFIERDTSMSRFYFFNITGLEVDESVLEAELHLYRKRTLSKSIHQSTLASSYYLISVYQVLDERSLDQPELHRLLDVRHVEAHASGWQIFNVKPAVLAWLNGEPNLGLLVTASTLFEDQVNVEFSRRNEYHHSKQPILVLFDDDGKRRRGDKKTVPRYYTYDNDNEIVGEISYDEDQKIDLKNEYDEKRIEKHDRRRGQPEEARWESENKSEFFQRQKRTQRGEHDAVMQEGKQDVADGTSRRRRRETISSRKLHRYFRSNSATDTGTLTSMDIYRRAMRRERMGEKVRQRSMSLLNSENFREKRSIKSHASVQQNVTECARHELYVDFKEIDLSSSIIAPIGYSAYHCKGICESPLSQDQQPTNHATIQGLVHQMGLVKGVERPCCVPTKLLSITILFFDDNENAVLKDSQDMIADRCGCR
ncbi:Bone morphogenetic protein 3 [Anthophora retusa]